MNKPDMITVDGNEAAASVVYLCNEVIAIYPITPASSMGELADEWAAGGKPNLWGAVPTVIEMQSEAGAAGTVHGALQGGALSTTFTASQGLLLMIPNMYKIAGELTPTVFHIAARAIATHALSIFGDHSDVMATRSTGFAMLASNNPQETQDMALIAQAATLRGRIPVLHFFDGFRTSHEVSKIAALDREAVRAMLDDALIAEHRTRSMSPEHPVLRGSSQNPDVFFQSRERINPFYSAFADIVQAEMDRFAKLTARQYRLFEYAGAVDADRVIVIMGSGGDTVEETVAHLNAHGEKAGVIKVRLFRPLDAQALLVSLPKSVKSIAVLDRCKEPGAEGEPLYKDVVTALAQAYNAGKLTTLPKVMGGRYGLASKEFTPGMVKAVFDAMKAETLEQQFTLGITDDLTHLSLPWDAGFRTDANRKNTAAVFYGLGSDGTVSANKNSIKIIGESTDLYAQGYFVYDSKKAGAVTVSHLRFGPDAIRSAYLVGNDEAAFVACHQQVFLERYDMLDHAAEGGVFLLNTQSPPEKAWETLPRRMQQQIIDKKLSFYVIDAYKVAEQAGMGRRINTVMQTCFFAISGILPREQAIAAIKQAVEKTYGRKGRRLVELNFKAIDATLDNLNQVQVPASLTSTREKPPAVREGAPEFVRRFTAGLIAGRGDAVPVSLMPADGTFPLGTAAWEKRNLALEIPVWEADLCTQCGKCVFVCPHSAIRSRLFTADAAANTPATFKHVAARSKEFAGARISYQVAPEDCTGCGICVEACPIHDKSNVSRKALNMAPQPPLRDAERDNFAFFLGLPEYDREKVKHTTIPGAMLLDPLFEFSGACSGCGETPYIRLATQLFGDRMLIANATGCSSIYGGNLPTTPYTTNSEGRGPAWNNSLFEDNAEFGLGLRLAADQLMRYARDLVKTLANEIGGELSEQILNAQQREEAEIRAQQSRVAALLDKLKSIQKPEARSLEAVAEYLIRRSVWIIGGDGWAYDIGYGGLDHVLAQPYDVNFLVLDTEVYSNTGGQTSKATPLGAVAKFSAGGKPARKKDLARIAMDYEHVYVAQVAFGAKDVHTLRVFHEAESYPGPSLIIAYSPCIAHGVDLSNNLRQQDLAVKSGHWPLFRYDPREREAGKNPLRLDSPETSIPFKEFASTETRFTMLARSHPEEAAAFIQAAEAAARLRYAEYKELSEMPLPSANKTETDHG
ncbi:MAG: pyruvate:ferredoxin (flavodoxin) oxidoreductase [Hydrogenophilaceae bacterium]|nr:pyruvate:ferredoxin (flavodoxin) oxidoreductase [Hydrogenophilaceae bacterium]